MASRVGRIGFALGLLLLSTLAAGCGSPEVKVDYVGAESAVVQPEGALPPETMVNMPTAEQQLSMVEAARITAEAMRTRKMPPADQMAKLPKEQQEAIKRALEGMNATP